MDIDIKRAEKRLKYLSKLILENGKYDKIQTLNM